MLDVDFQKGSAALKFGRIVEEMVPVTGSGKVKLTPGLWVLLAYDAYALVCQRESVPSLTTPCQIIPRDDSMVVVKNDTDRWLGYYVPAGGYLSLSRLENRE